MNIYFESRKIDFYSKHACLNEIQLSNENKILAETYVVAAYKALSSALQVQTHLHLVCTRSDFDNVI